VHGDDRAAAPTATMCSPSVTTTSAVGVAVTMVRMGPPENTVAVTAVFSPGTKEREP